MNIREDSSQKTIVFTVMVRVVPAAALLLILIWLGIRYLSLGSLEKKFQSTLAARSEMVASAVGEKLDDLRRYTHFLSSNDLIINSLIDQTARENYLPAFFQSLEVPGVDNANVSLSDYRGRYIISNSSDYRDFQDSDIQSEVMAGNNVFRIKENIIDVAMPVFYIDLPEGMIVLSVTNSDFSKLFSMLTLDTTVEYAIILEPNGLIYASETLFYKEITNLPETIQNQNITKSRQKQKSDNGEDEEWLKNRVNVPGYENLHIICGMKKDSHRGEYSRMDRFLVAAMMLDLAALILGIYMSSRLTGKPLSVFVKLIDSARQSRKYMADLPETGPHEIRSLASAFNSLIMELEKARAESMNTAIEAGRAQLSAMVLHNIGNAVTPLNIQINRMDIKEISTIQEYLQKCYMDLENNMNNLSEYVQTDPRGRQVFEYLEELIVTLKEAGERQKEKIESASGAVSYISEILSLQHHYAATGKEIRELVSINSIMETAWKINRSALEKSGINLQMDLQPDMPKLFIDKSRLLQVVINILKNSCEAIEQLEIESIKYHDSQDNLKKENNIQIVKDSNIQKNIKITTLIDRNKIGFTVKDSGIGINLPSLESLFEFGASDKGSSGMGLYYCKMFVEVNNGTIEMTSQGLGKGAVITILFPKAI
ncbi:putative Histidine kinase [Desulfamplus magnetovallimortis]|uniref:histidine kinase n=1 Tax=Desulfamplus magnetovallimortis TaxID=1246637 RepID=A0A1W1HJ82_9BACT|nr:HAMP domain-containing sensor histidine kinase [Desulfamplus magnetovallimortis]SLM32520.1 putative Histidine kinase [Desulfamplus magnetovallimortis]